MRLKSLIRIKQGNIVLQFFDLADASLVFDFCFAPQVLKLIRYTTKLALASALADSKSELATRLKAFESSIGTSRCAQFGRRTLSSLREHEQSRNALIWPLLP